MVIKLHTDPAPLRLDETGTIRVGDTRITLDVVLADYRNGKSPEEIVRQLDTLKLADVHAAIGYYLRHQDEIDAYLLERNTQADELKRRIESEHPDRASLKSQLLARMTPRNGDDASTSQ